MPQVDYDVIGFGIPLVLALVYAPRALRLAGTLDWFLFVAMTAMTVAAGYCDAYGGHLPAVYGFAIMYYLCLPSVSRRQTHKSAGMLLPFLFASIALPDVYVAHTQGCSDSVTVGGNGWVDGIFLRSIVGFVGYGITATIARCSADYRRGARTDWRRELSRHFTLAPGQPE
jgi:hypothetical protein